MKHQLRHLIPLRMSGLLAHMPRMSWADRAAHKGKHRRCIEQACQIGLHAREGRRAPPAPSFPRTRTRGQGWRPRPARRPETTPSAPPAASAVRSGAAGAATTDEVWSRYEPGRKTIRGIVFPANGCGASMCPENVSLSWFEGKPLPGNAWHMTSTGSWQSSGSGRSRVLSDQWRSAAHSMNRFTALGTPQTQRVG